MPQNKQILLDNRPQGEASAANFKLVTSETPALKEGDPVDLWPDASGAGRHLLQAQPSANAVPALAAIVQAALDRGDSVQARAWLAQMPQESPRKGPELALIRARMALLTATLPLLPASLVSLK